MGQGAFDARLGEIFAKDENPGTPTTAVPETGAYPF
jgi:hypothetical protein